MFSYPHAPESPVFSALRNLECAVFDIPISGASAVEVSVAAGAWFLSAKITNPGDLVGGEVLQWDDSGGVYRDFDPEIGLLRDLIETKVGILTYPLAKVKFPINAIGAVSVIAPSGFTAPTITNL